MPRRPRQPGPAPGRRSQRTVFGRPWPLPVSPVAIGLLLAFVAVAGVVWYAEGRFTTTPAEVARQIVPFSGEDVQSILVVTPDGRASFERGPDGKMTAGGPPPTPTPVPPPEATPGPVTISPATRVESLVNQVAALRIDRVVLDQPSQSAEYGLDQPQMTLTLTPKQGAAATLAVGALNPDETSYYVRRDQRRDTVLVSRYTLDDLLKTAKDAIQPGA
jgi:hypothetical protein